MYFVADPLIAAVGFTLFFLFRKDFHHGDTYAITNGDWDVSGAKTAFNMPFPKKSLVLKRIAVVVISPFHVH